MPQQHGLKDRIRRAQSDNEIKNLLAEGATYSGATDETRRDWERLATRREGELVTAAEGKKLRQNLSGEQSPAPQTKRGKKA